MFRFISRIDRKVQRVVNAAGVALMERYNLKKATILLTTIVLMVGAGLIAVAARLAQRDYDNAIIGGIISALTLYLWTGASQRVSDAEEMADWESLQDARIVRLMKWCFSMQFIIGLTLFLVQKEDPDQVEAMLNNWYTAGHMTKDTLFILAAYVLRIPRKPPPRRKKVEERSPIINPLNTEA